MQPYLFPYIGYFQLVNAADIFVLHDDVQYIKGGWINRNRILQNGKDALITLNIKNDSAYKNINERNFSDDFEDCKKKLLRVIQNNYHKAPFSKEVTDLLKEIFAFEDSNVSTFIKNSILQINNYLEIKTPVLLSSSVKKNNETKGEERVLELSKCCNATAYFNPIGGIQLYSKENFSANNIDLSFIKANDIVYSQQSTLFVPNLSIIDVLMFNDIEKVKGYLTQYSFV